MNSSTNIPPFHQHRCIDCSAICWSTRCSFCYRKNVILTKPAVVCVECGRVRRKKSNKDHAGERCRICVGARARARQYRESGRWYVPSQTISLSKAISKKENGAKRQAQISLRHDGRLFLRQKTISIAHSERYWSTIHRVAAFRWREQIEKLFRTQQAKERAEERADFRRFILARRLMERQVCQQEIEEILARKRVQDVWNHRAEVVSPDCPLPFEYDFYQIIGDARALTPLEELIQQEEWEEEKKILSYRRNRDKRVEFAEPIDLEDAHIEKLLATAPKRKGNRGKYTGKAIGRYSPERDIAQRHIKMSPTQFA